MLENQRHDLEDGDWVEFSEVKGMTPLNKRQYEVKGMGFVHFCLSVHTLDSPRTYS